VTKLLDEVHLNAREGSGDGEEGGVSVVDMGSGVGKLCVQLLLQYECVTRIDGFELAISRYKLGKQALQELVDDGWGEGTAGEAEGGSKRQAHTPFHLVHSSTNSTTVASPPLTIPASAAFPTPLALPSRSLTLSRANLFSPAAVRAACTADIVIIETLITADCLCLLARLLESLRTGARLLTFHDIRPLWPNDAANLATHHEAAAKRRADCEAEPGGAEAGEEAWEAVEELRGLRYGECPFVQLAANGSKLDRFMTSWSQRRGHYFFLYCKVV